MAGHLLGHAGLKATFNFVPVLLDQLDARPAAARTSCSGGSAPVESLPRRSATR
jgi:hypothetical protein